MNDNRKLTREMCKIMMIKKQRGVFERLSGSGVWWIQFFDADGRRRREKVGSKANAIALVEKRRTAVRAAQKLPENFRARAATFADLAKDCLAYSSAHKLSFGHDAYRMPEIVNQFGARSAESITPQEIDRWLQSHTVWANGTKNRYLALLKLTYRLANENGKVTVNPARLVRQRREDNARIRFLLTAEEQKLRMVIEAKYPVHLPELEIALNTGMRRGEQYATTWDNVDVANRRLTVPRSKHGERRYIPLNHSAIYALASLRASNDDRNEHLFLSARTAKPLTKNRHWFEDAIAEANIANFTWHDLRHTFASRLIMAGVDLRTVQELMGHKTIQMTCRYAHLAPSHQLAAVDRLDQPTATSSATTPLAEGATIQ